MATPPRRPLGRGGGPTKGTAKSMLAWALLVVLTAAVQSRSVPAQQSIETLVASTPSTGPSPLRRSQAGSSPPEIPLLNHQVTTAKFRSTDDESPNHNHKFNALAPAPANGAVRAPLAQPDEFSHELSLTSARLLRNWEAENIVLLATIDGAIHARDRASGDPRWSLGIPNSPMIQTVHHCHNNTADGEHTCDHEYVFIVEPTKDGMIYIQHKDPRVGLQRLGVTVKDLALDTPGFVENPPLVTIAQTETTAYVVDAASGAILSQFNRQSAFVPDHQDNSCRKPSGFELDDPACDPIGTINLGRVEYTVEISHKLTMERLCTIKFAEWLPNKQDNDLQDQYISPLDDTSHIQTYHNGKIQALRPNPVGDTGGNWWRDMGTPVARVFDVVRPVDRGPELGELKVLSRPLNSPLLNSAQYWGNDLLRMEKVFVNKTESGFWYALSELAYPGVTAGAKDAAAFFAYDRPMNWDEDLDNIIGVHVLSRDSTAAPVRLTIEGRPQTADVDAEPDKPVSKHDGPLTPPAAFPSASSLAVLTNFIAVSIVLFLLGLHFRMPAALKLKHWLRLKGIEVILTDPNVESLDRTPAHVTEETAATTTQPPAATEKAEIGLGETDADPRPVPAQIQTQSTSPTDTGSRKEDKNAEDGENGSDAESDDENDQSLSKEDHPEPGITTVGRLRITTRDDACLGRGSNGTIVFPGTMDDGRLVAVKRLQRHSSALAAKEIKHLLSSDENPHVVRYFGKEESHNFIYIALDLFRTSLDRFVERPLEFPDLIKFPEGFDVKDCLAQITEGMRYLHSLKLVHRDIKPQNVLVKQVKTSRPTPGPPKLNFVISDFGLCKPLEEGPESAFAPTANHTAAGTTGWRAPELLVSPSDSVAAPNGSTSASRSVAYSTSHSATHSTTHSATHSADGTVVEPTTGRRATKAIDIFSLGCVFYYVMTQGRHPFDVGGTSLGRDLNIKEDRFSTQELTQFFGYSYDAEDLVMQMINHEPKYRPDTTSILKHPFFWDDEKKLEFICAVSDCYEKEKNSVTDIHNPNAVRTEAELRSLEELAALEKLGPNVILRGDFLQELPRSFIQEMGKQRRYTGSKMIDLLRVIRNKKNHFHDLPDDVKEMMLGGSVNGYWAFWEQRFKSLLINCHCILIERDLTARFKMERYYQ
ncbi:hypothetical protein DV736_g85, partial [Chaetothyriales sp. CBS 134916]